MRLPLYANAARSTARPAWAKTLSTHPVLGGKACFGCGGNVRAIDDPTVQAEYYIISYLPPEPNPADREAVISRILAANGYTKGTAGVYFAVSASGPEALGSFHYRR